jgi:hypothetical protein
MMKFYTAFCVLVVLLMTIANSQGYVMTSLLSGTARADKTINHYHK